MYVLWKRRTQDYAKRTMMYGNFNSYRAGEMAEAQI